MEKRTHILATAITAIVMVICSVGNAFAVCSDPQGSYKIENNVNLYIHKKNNADYMAIMSGEKQSELLLVTLLSKEQSKAENLPECSVLITGVGVLMPSEKGKTYHVTAESQNYLTERKTNTPFVLLVMAGFQSDIYGVDKTSDILPKNILSEFN